MVRRGLTQHPRGGCYARTPRGDLHAMNPRFATRSKVGAASESAPRDEAALDALVDLDAALPRALGALSDVELDRLRDALHARAEALARRAVIAVTARVLSRGA